MLLLLASILVLTTSHEHCRFTVSPSLSHPSTHNKLYIGTTCEEWNCEIILLKCFPSIHLSIGTLWESNNSSSVTWHNRSGTCTVMGEIDLSPFQPILMDVYLIMEPQSCFTANFESSTIRLNANHFQDFVANSTTPVTLSTTPSASYVAPLSKPDTSPLFAVPGEDKLLYWTSSGSSYLNTDFSSSPSPCSDPSNTLQPIKLAPDTLLILHNGQLFSLFQNQTNYQNISHLCFTSLKLADGMFNNPAYAITTGLNNQILSISQDLTITTVVEDLEIYLATQSIDEYIVIDHIGLSNHARHTLLIRDEETELQHIVHVHGEVYELAYTFPTDYDMVSEPTVLDDSGSDHPLNITHLYCIQSSSPHIVAMGSVALYSASFGHSWYNLPVNTTSSNYSFIKDDNGRYAIQTPTNLYSGLFGEVIDLSDKTYSDQDFTPSALITVEGDEIIQTFYNTDATNVSEYQVKYNVHAIEGLIQELDHFEEFLAGVRQYDINYVICADHDPSFTRRIPARWSQDLSQEEDHCYDYVPKLVYLEYGKSFVFNVTFTMSRLPAHLGVFYLVQKSHLAVNLWDSDLLSVEIEKKARHIEGEVVVSINLTDRGTDQQQYLPGAELKGVSVEVVVNEQSEMFHVALGCPPGLEIAFDFDNTEFLLSGTHKEANVSGTMVDVVWFQYEQLFKPVFKIIDLIGATERQYIRGYNLTIIGGGIDPDSLEMYDDEFLAVVNTNDQAASVWHWTKDKHFNSTNNEIRWLCRESSPCHDVLPNSLAVPQYCFIVKFSNRDIVGIDSYCIFETEFVTCVHGLPLGILQSIVVLVMVLAFFFVGIAVHYVKLHGVSWDEVRCKTNEEDDDDETTAFLKAQAMRQTRMKSRRQSSIIPELQNFKRASLTV